MRYLLYAEQNYSYAILRPLQEAIRRRGDEVVWFLVGSEINRDYLRADEIQLLSVDDVVRWKPNAVFAPGNIVPSFIPGVKVEVFHGLNSGKVNRKGREYHFEIRHCFDLYCTHGPSTTPKFEQLARKFGTFTVAETGWPVLDPLFATTQDNPYVIQGDQRPLILFCSTFSRKLTCAPAVFEKVKQLAETSGWRWLVQFHPKMDKEIVNLYKSIHSDNLQFVETDNVLPLLQAADVMLCDTSSVLQMFILQQKPVVTFNNQNPGPHLIDVSELADIETAICEALEFPQQLQRQIAEYCQQIHPYTDGLSSDRVLNATEQLINNGRADLRKKPLNLLRNFKQRRKLGYWKFS